MTIGGEIQTSPVGDNVLYSRKSAGNKKLSVHFASEQCPNFFLKFQIPSFPAIKQRRISMGSLAVVLSQHLFCQ